MMTKQGYHGRPPLFEVAAHAFFKSTGLGRLWVEFFDGMVPSELERWKSLMGKELREFIHSQHAHLAQGGCDCDAVVRRFDVMYDSNAVVLRNLATTARQDCLLGIIQFTAEYLQTTRLWRGYDSG